MNSGTFNNQPSLGSLAASALAMFVFVAGLIFGAAGASASTAGTPAEFRFNHAALYTGTSVAGAIDDFILQPGDGKNEVTIRGTYVDSEGSFVVPVEGFDFPEFEIKVIPGLSFDAGLALVDEARGRYDESTGELVFKPTLALSYGMDDVSTLPVEGPEGPLECVLTRLDTSLTSYDGWPHPGAAFASPETASGGSIAGAWRSRPPVQANQGGSICEVIANLVDPVGGLWLANSPVPIESLPAATSPRPTQLPYVNPVVPVDPKPDPQDDPSPAPSASTTLRMATSPMRARAGSLVRMPVRATNRGESAEVVTMRLRSSNRRVKVPKSLSMTVPAGTTVARKIPVRVLGKARGKARITVKSGNQTGSRWIRVR